MASVWLPNFTVSQLLASTSIGQAKCDLFALF